MQQRDEGILRRSGRVLKWFLKEELFEEVSGDLYEYYSELEGLPVWRRKLLFWFHLLHFLRPFAIKKLEGTQKLNLYGMFKHNLIITLRGFKKHKVVFGINLMGLIASLTCVLFSVIWIDDELQKDRMHADTDHLFQVYSKFLSSTETRVWKGVSGLLETEIENQIPQAAVAAVTTDVHEYTLNVGNRGFKVHGRFADEDYLKVLHYPLLEGAKNALADPSNILITESLALKLFGRTDVIGETISWHFWVNQKTFKVAGILEDLTSQTSEPFEFILPWVYFHDEMIDYKDWGNFYGRVLVKVNPKQKEVTETKINEIFQANFENDQIQLFLTSYVDQYLYGKYEDGEQAGGRIDYVHLISVVAVFILMIACINFINLRTAFASLKTKEIGVKKSFGASKRNLASQFFFESILLAALATVIAVLLIGLLLEPFNRLSGKELSLASSLRYIGMACLFIPSVGIIAGLYPAFYLSNLEIISALKSRVSGNQLRCALGRQTLVFIQFTLSIILIVGTLVVSRQMDYALNKNLGYDRDNLLYFYREGKLLEDDKAFMESMKTIPGVMEVSKSAFSVGPEIQNRTAGIDWVGKEEGQIVAFWENKGDAKSVEILGLELVAGRNFNDVLQGEESSVIFNETAIQLMGMENPIGQVVEHYSGKKEIIGVVKDFTTESLHQPQEPAMFFCKPELAPYIMVKIEKGKEIETISKMESLYKEFNPVYPFEPGFIDQDYEAMYKAEMRIAKLSSIFSGLAIIISCMGLFGLTIFQVQRKVKEIGIKKVLGANVWKLALSMTYHYTKSVFAALIFALPISYYVGKNWLASFTDSVTLSWWMFGLAALVAIAIAWITVGSQTIRAANANPVASLKDD